MLALAAAASWGGGDFSGGMGVKAAARDAGDATQGALRLVIVAHAVSLSVLLVLLFAQRAAWPAGVPMAWALVAGVAAAGSLTAFYMALARGEMGVSAAISGLLAAAIPAVVSAVTEGAPGHMQMAGFVLAGLAIWAIAAGPSPENAEGVAARGTMALAIAGGLGFGFYFVALKMANPLGVLEPMALARGASLATCVVLLVVVGIAGRESTGVKSGRLWSVWLSRRAVWWAMGVALLDTGGNLLFLAATRAGRLDVAGVLASLYPAGTILLAAWRLQERPTRRQVGGMVLALAAVMFIAV